MCTKTKTTKHNHLCSMAFGKPSKHSDCPRCEELKNGAEPIKWNKRVMFGNDRKITDVYCFSVSVIHSRCTIETNPSCNCGKMSYTD